MKGKFTHYLITRYNVPIPGFQVDKGGQTTRDEKWLQHRFDLFQKFCLPSVLHQTNNDFQWLIYIDHNTPEKFYSQLFEILQDHNHIHLYRVTDHKDTLHHLDQYIRLVPTPYVITSRLDNDDALGVNFVENVQRNFIEKDKVLLNFLHGIGFDYKQQIVSVLYNIRNNHFTSLIEVKKTGGGHLTVRGFQHDEVPDDFLVINIPSKFSWLKTFHERNVKSKTFGYPFLNLSLDKKFGLQKNTLDTTPSKVFGYLIWWLGDGIKRKIFRIRK